MFQQVCSDLWFVHRSVSPAEQAAPSKVFLFLWLVFSAHLSISVQILGGRVSHGPGLCFSLWHHTGQDGRTAQGGVSGLFFRRLIACLSYKPTIPVGVRSNNALRLVLFTPRTSLSSGLLSVCSTNSIYRLNRNPGVLLLRRENLARQSGTLDPENKGSLSALSWST